MMTDCEKQKKDFTYSGDFIEARKAKEFLQLYLGDTDTKQPPPTDMNHVIGYLFGLTKIKELISKIEGYNKDQANIIKITGIRIYNAKSERTDPDFKGVLRDVMLVPVMEDGEDYPEKIFKEKALIDPLMILAGSRPCPNQCPTLYFYNS
jgi:hypothetical protein